MLNKSFFKFFFGFMFMVAVSFSIIIVTNYFSGEQSKVGDEVIISN
ncbi:hypothetical protein KKC45_03275 [Patescibacteria group bacterium]|nr:hypothetical protein [Patescibacteria group bacterium]